MRCRRMMFPASTAIRRSERTAASSLSRNPLRNAEPNFFCDLQRSTDLCALPSSAATRIGLLSRSTRKCACQRNRGYVTRWAVRFRRIVSEVFLNHANGLHSGHSLRHTGHPVLSRDTEQLLMHQEAIGKAFHPAQAGSITPDAGSVSVPFAVYAGTDFQEVAARSAHIRLLRCALWRSVGRRANKEESK